MALLRRSGQRVTSSIWTGFVDAMTGLLLVFMFVLSMFMIVQFVLSGTITSQSTQLSEREKEISNLRSQIKIKDDELARLAIQISGLIGDIEDKDSFIVQLESTIADQNDKSSRQTSLIQQLEIQIANNLDQISTLLAELSAIENQKSELKLAAEQADQQIADLRAIQDELENDILVINKISRQQQQRIEELDAALTNSNDNVVALVAELDSLTAIRRRLENQLSVLNSRLADQKVAETDLQAALDESKSEIQDKITLITEYQTQLDQLKKDMKALNADLAIVRDNLAEQVAERELLDQQQRTKIQSLSELLRSIQEEKQKQAKLIIALNEELDIIKDAKFLLEREVQQSSEVNNVLSEENISLAGALAEMNQQNQRMRQSLQNLQIQLEDLNQVVNKLEIKLETTEDELILVRNLQIETEIQLAELQKLGQFDSQQLNNLKEVKSELSRQLYDSRQKYGQLLEAKESLEDYSNDQERQLVSLQEEINRLSEQIKASAEKLTSETARLNTENELRLKALEDIEQLQIALGAESEEKERLQNRVNETQQLITRLSALETTFDDKNKELIILESEYEQNLEEYNQLKVQLNDEIRENRRLEAQVDFQLDQIELLNDEIASNKDVTLSNELQIVLQAENKRLESELAFSKKQTETFEKILSEEIEKRTKIATEVRSLTARLNESEQFRQSAREKSDQDQELIILLNTQLAELRRDLATLQETLNDSQERADASQVQISSLGTQLNEALAEKAALNSRLLKLEQAESERLKQENLNLDKFRSEFFGQLRQILENRPGIEVAGDRFVFASEVLFNSGEVVLSQSGEQQISSVAELILELASEFPKRIDWVLRIDGHTDNVSINPGGDFADNWELSQARSLAVVRYLIKEYNFPATRLAATGFGEYRPIASNATLEGRSKNRRIEFKLTKP